MAESGPYLLVARAISAAHFTFDDVLRVQLSEGLCTVVSEYVGGEDGWPLSLRGEIRGPASDLDDAQHRLSESIGALFPLVTLAANAAHVDPGIVVVHGLTPTESSPADWISYAWPPADSHFPPQARTVEARLVGSLLEAADRYPSDGYHARATAIYREALKYWAPESTLLAAEYLWMATEALSRGIVEAEATKAKITPSNLSQLRKVGSVQALYKRTREEVIFNEDAEALHALEEASDGFEHGYKTIPEVRALAEPVLLRAAHKVRHALISVLDMPEQDKAALLAEEFDEPRGLTPPLRVFRGELLVVDPTLAPEEIADAVEVDWEAEGRPQYGRSPEGKLTITGQTRMTMKALPPGITLALTAPGMRVQGATDYAVGEVVVRRAGEQPSESPGSPREGHDNG